MKRTLLIGLGLLLLGTLAIGVVVQQRRAAPIPSRVVETMPFYPLTIDDITLSLMTGGAPPGHTDNITRLHFTVDAPAADVVARYRAQWAAKGWTVMDPATAGISTIVRVRSPIPGSSPSTCTKQGQFEVYEGPTQKSSVTVFLRITCTGPGASPSGAEHPSTAAPSAEGTMPFYPVVEGEQTRTAFSVMAPAVQVVAAYRAQWEATGWTILYQRQEGSTTRVQVTGDVHDHRGIHCMSSGSFQVSPRVGPQGGEVSAVAVDLQAICSNGFIY